MAENKDFDIEDFLEKVFKEFQFLQSTKELEKVSPDDLQEPFRNHFSGCLFIPLVRLIKPYQKKALEKVIRENSAFHREALDFLSEPEIKKAICRSLNNFPKKEILTTEKFLKLITETLTEKRLRKKFVIPLDPKVFSFVAFEIFEMGIENFCDGINDEK